MWMVTILVLLSGGLLGASNIIIGKRPEAKQLIDKLVPYQGVIGLIMLLWGLRDAVQLVRSVSTGGHITLSMLTFLTTTLTELALGFLLGYSLIVKYVLGSNTEAVAKAERVRSTLRAYQGRLGVAAIVLAAVYFLASVGR